MKLAPLLLAAGSGCRDRNDARAIREISKIATIHTPG